jgi:tRNA(fMet)-specific endonuclease VapC
MGKDILLDTSAIVAHLRGKIDIRDFAPAEALLFTSLFSVGELAKGINRANDPDRERAKVELFLADIAILTPDTATAEAYGKIAAGLDGTGQRIPENDAWIAAVAIECDMTLAAGDAHFTRVRGLDLLHLLW